MKTDYWPTVARGLLETLSEKEKEEDRVRYVAMRLELLYNKGREDIRSHMRAVLDVPSKGDMVSYENKRRSDDDDEDDHDTDVGYYNE